MAQLSLVTNWTTRLSHLHQLQNCPPAGPDGYPRVLDYSIFKSLLVPYSENFTTRPSSRVVAIFTFFVRIIQISKKWKSNTSMMTSCNNPNNVHLPLSWNSCTKRGMCILLIIIFESRTVSNKIKAESTKYKIPPNSGFGVVWHHSFLGHWKHADT